MPAVFYSALLAVAFTAIPARAAELGEYVLQPGDVVSVNVVEHPEFSIRQRIRPDGKINYPVVGEIEVAALTTAELVKVMEGKLASYINNPTLSVSIEEYYANKIYVIGAVRSTGVFQIFEPLDVMKVLVMCGGIASRTRFIKIIRADGTIVKVPMKGFWGDDVKRQPNVYVMYPGDCLYVPPSFEIPWGLYLTILTAISSTISVTLLIISLGP